MARLTTRRRMLLTGLAAPALLVGCDRLGGAPSFRETILSSGEWLSYRVHRLIGSDALAREYDPSEMSPDFRTNGNTQPTSEDYRRHQEEGFANWTLAVGGAVARPRAYTLADLRAKPARTQITRHDCVEGWSAIGQWTGVPLGLLLDEAELRPEARYIVFRCADAFGSRPAPRDAGRALWVLDLVERGEFSDPSEAAFVLLDQARDLDPHHDLRRELLSRVLRDTAEGPLLEAEEVRAPLEAAMRDRAEPATWRPIGPDGVAAHDAGRSDHIQ